MPEAEADSACQSPGVDRKWVGRSSHAGSSDPYQVAQESARVQLPRRDPADRFLVATARVFDLTLVTADEHLLKARQVPVLANR